jgi:hypothetical protein
MLKAGDVCSITMNEWSCKIDGALTKFDKSSLRMIPSGSLAIILDISDSFADVIVAGIDGRWYVRGISLSEIDNYDK